MKIRLPLAPSSWSRPRFNGKRAFLDKKSQLFKLSVSRLLFNKGYPCLQGPLEVSVRFVLMRPKSTKRHYPSVRPDLDNYLKAIFDAANEILWEDDAQIVKLSAEKLYGVGEPFIELQIKQLGDIDVI